MKTEAAQKILEKTKQNYEELAEEFSHTRVYYWPEMESLMEYVKGGSRVLDLGCGNGRLVDLFKNRKIEYTGLDNCQKLITIARQKHPGVKFLIGDALEIPLKDESFDVIFSIALLHHIPSNNFRLKILKNCERLLKPGGFLILTVWNFWQPKLLFRYKIWPIIFGWRPRGLEGRDVFIPWKLPSGPIQRYYHVFTPPEIRRLVQQAGFSIIDSYFARKSERASFFNGFNLTVVAKKT